VKLSDRLIERSSPYQLNAMAYLGGAGCMLVAVAGFRLLPTGAFAFLIVALLCAAVGLFRLAARGICPKCGASPRIPFCEFAYPPAVEILPGLRSGPYGHHSL
jgi:hypothetical protein